MISYRLYYLQASALTGSDEIEAADDGDAGRLAKARADGHTVEIWRDDRKIRTLAPAELSPPIP